MGLAFVYCAQQGAKVCAAFGTIVEFLEKSQNALFLVDFLVDRA